MYIAELIFISLIFLIEIALAIRISKTDSMFIELCDGIDEIYETYDKKIIEHEDEIIKLKRDVKEFKSFTVEKMQKKIDDNSKNKNNKTQASEKQPAQDIERKNAETLRVD